MVIKTLKGMYEVIKNIRDAYNEDKFNEAYLEEYFDSYEYIVGDIASEKLRLKGFSQNPNNPNYFKKIPDYLTESCAYKGAYFILRRIGEEEYKRLYEKYKNKPNPELTTGDYTVKTIEKVSFDKDNLVLESSAHRDPNIVLDMARINSIKTFPLPDDLKEEAEEAKQKELKNNKQNNYNKNKYQEDYGQQNNRKFSNMNGNKKVFSNNKK